jgi:hypothetical protein
MAAAAPDNVVAGFRNAGVSLIMDEDRVIRDNVTAQTARFLLENVIREELLGLAEEEENDEELNVHEYILRIFGRLAEEEEA